MGTISCGHGNPLVKEHIIKQLDNISASSFFPTNIQLSLIEQLNKILPESLYVTSLYSTGSEAVEYAIRLARAATNRNKVISCRGHFHGKTHGIMYLAENIPAAYGYAPENYSSTIALDLTHEDITEKLEQIVDKDTAAIIFEPLPGQEGGISLPEEIFHVIQEVCEINKTLIIADEILTGFYRCSEWFLSPSLGISPDIICFGKGLGNGLPISGVACREYISAHAKKALPGSTFSGNPLACAAACGVLEFMGNNDIQANTRALEVEFNNYFNQNSFLDLGVTAHGTGALLGLTFSDHMAEDIKKMYISALTDGVILSHSARSLRITPPLTIEKDAFVSALHTIGNTIKLYK